jgi:hypothetical protein
MKAMENAFLRHARRYVSRMTPIDARILTRSSARYSDPLSGYLDGLVEFQPSQTNLLDVGADAADLAIYQSGCKRLHAIPWKFRRTSVCEFPHTIHDSIILPTSFFHFSFDRQIEILIHEKIHIWQKTFPQQAEKYVHEVMGYRPIKTLDLAMRYEYHVRANPDTNDTLYARNGTNAYPLQVFKDSQATSLADSEIIVLPHDSNVRYKYEYEHPFEEMAYVLSKQIFSSQTLHPDVVIRL